MLSMEVHEVTSHDATCLRYSQVQRLTCRPALPPKLYDKSFFAAAMTSQCLKVLLTGGLTFHCFNTILNHA